MLADIMRNVRRNALLTQLLKEGHPVDENSIRDTRTYLATPQAQDAAYRFLEHAAGIRNKLETIRLGDPFGLHNLKEHLVDYQYEGYFIYADEIGINKGIQKAVDESFYLNTRTDTYHLATEIPQSIQYTIAGINGATGGVMITGDKTASILFGTLFTAGALIQARSWATKNPIQRSIDEFSRKIHVLAEHYLE